MKLFQDFVKDHGHTMVAVNPVFTSEIWNEEDFDHKTGKVADTVGDVDPLCDEEPQRVAKFVIKMNLWVFFLINWWRYLATYRQNLPRAF